LLYILILGCDSTVDATTQAQDLSSPNYPNNYINNLVCQWVILTGPGMLIGIDFISFDLERHRDFLVCMNFLFF